MKTEIEGLKDWICEIEEISAGAYEISLAHISGLRIQLVGADPVELLKKAKLSAAESEQNLKIKRPNPRGR